MEKEPYRDLIEIEALPEGSARLTVSSYHVIDLLTYLKEVGVHASGQNPPLFGFEDFPTIYYVNFLVPSQRIVEEVRSYLKNKSLNYKEIEREGSDDQKPAVVAFVAS
jgi:hypothetical protein